MRLIGGRELFVRADCADASASDDAQVGRFVFGEFDDSGVACDESEFADARGGDEEAIAGVAVAVDTGYGGSFDGDGEIQLGDFCCQRAHSELEPAVWRQAVQIRTVGWFSLPRATPSSQADTGETYSDCDFCAWWMASVAAEPIGSPLSSQSSTCVSRSNRDIRQLRWAGLS
jgi:hypothetical protein